MIGAIGLLAAFGFASIVPATESAVTANANAGMTNFHEPRENPTRRIVFVVHLTDAKSLTRIQSDLRDVILCLRQNQVFNIFASTEKGPPISAFPEGPSMATRDKKLLATAFVNRLADIDAGTGPGSAIVAAMRQNPTLFYFMTDAETLEKSLPRTFGNLNAKRHARINSILYQNYSEGAQASMKQIAAENDGNYVDVREKDAREAPATRP